MLANICRQCRARRGHRPWPRVTVDADSWQAAIGKLAAGEATLARPVGRCKAAVHMALSGDAQPSAKSRSSPANARAAPSRRRRTASAGDPAGARDPRSLRLRGRGRARHAALARSRRLGRRASARRRAPGAGETSRYAFLPVEGEACTRFRSARSMPASSSRAISASPPTARPWCGWKSGSAMSTRASRR